jgi:hypothetical protein
MFLGSWPLMFTTMDETLYRKENIFCLKYKYRNITSMLCVFVQGEFQTQKEAAWAVSNLTISGSPQQVNIYL